MASSAGLAKADRSTAGASRARYGVVGFALSLAILSYIQRVAISQAATPIANDLHLDKQQLGAVLGAFGLSYALFEVPMGLLGDRLGVRRVLAQVVLAWSAFTALTGLAWNLTSLWIVRFLFGAGEAGCFPNLTRMLSRWLPRGERIKAQALLWASTRWGGAVTPPLALLGIELFGWRWSFVAFALLGLVWCVVFLRHFRENPEEHPKVNAAELQLLENSRNLMAHSHASNWWAVLLAPKPLMLMAQYFCWSYVWYFFVTWLPTYLREVHGQSAAATAGLAVLPLLCGGFGSLISGLLPLRVPRRLVAVLAFVIVALLLVAVPHVQSVALVVAMMAAISFVGDFTVPISWNCCVEVGQKYTATVGASMNMFANFSGFIAPVVAGIILKANGNDWTPVLYLMAGVAALGALLWLIVDPTGEAQPAPLEP